MKFKSSSGCCNNLTDLNAFDLIIRKKHKAKLHSSQHRHKTKKSGSYQHPYQHKHKTTYNCKVYKVYNRNKTERNLATRLTEHSDPQKSSTSKHLSECEHANYILNLNHIFDNLNDINDSDTNKPDTPLSFHNLIQAKTQTLHTLEHTNSNLVLFLEALYIKYRKPVLNIGLKASKKLVVFS